MKPIKCVVIGDGAVGKTSLLMSYTSNAFPGEYIITVFDNYTTNLIIDNIPINLQLWDTAGQENLNLYRKLAYPNTDVFMLCFSLINLNSYDNILNYWKVEIEQYSKGVPIILIGLKSDLRNNDSITTEKGKKLQKEIGAINYIECSAKTSENLNEVFNQTCRAVLNKENNLEIKNNDISCSNCLLI